jgi:hypothetical protein
VIPSQKTGTVGMNKSTRQPETNKNSAILNLEALARLMDSRFKIPGTNIRFGLDALIGLIPGAGDLGTFMVSGYMLAVLSQNGASGYVLAKMTLNIVIDSLIGAIPVIGDLFDIFFKANQRNMKLMREHFVEGRHRGGAWKVVVPLLLILFLLIAGIAWLSYKFFSWLF